MLRITATDNPRTLTFRLEGRLEGPWVSELEQCWRSLIEEESRPAVCVDLTGVTYVDAAGKARLGVMYEQGAKFITCDCVMEAVVAEIAEGTGQFSAPEVTEHDAATRPSSAENQRGRGGS